MTRHSPTKVTYISTGDFFTKPVDNWGYVGAKASQPHIKIELNGGREEMTVVEVEQILAVLKEQGYKIQAPKYPSSNNNK